MSETIFSKIIRREIPADIVYENDRVLAFNDINPQAPVHILVIPKQSLARLEYATKQDQSILGELLLVASEVARKVGIEAGGYRLVINNGANGAQTVEHLHIHLLGGRQLGWPPG